MQFHTPSLLEFEISKQFRIVTFLKVVLSVIRWLSIGLVCIGESQEKQEEYGKNSSNQPIAIYNCHS